VSFAELLALVIPLLDRAKSAHGADLVLAKLEWAAASDSDRQRRDVASILAVADHIDSSYIDRWAPALGVQDAWEALRDQVREG
jgi:hypothetical protein